MSSRRPAWALLVIASCSLAQAESTVAPLLKSLDLIDYSTRPTPPHFDGRTVETRRVSLGDLRGKVVLVNFWASWCAECRPEMPGLERLHRELGSRGLAIVGINLREEPQVVRRYASELGLTFPLVLDPDGRINRAYGVVGLPTTFIVGRDGRAVALAVGAREWAGPRARALLQALLAEPATGPGAP